MITGLNFDTQIAEFYLRNNRSTRQKSLRCFPSCGIKGHISGNRLFIFKLYSDMKNLIFSIV